VVRANNIFQKLRDRDGLDEAQVLARLDCDFADELATSMDDPSVGVTLEASRSTKVADQPCATWSSPGWRRGVHAGSDVQWLLSPLSVLNEGEPTPSCGARPGGLFRNQLTRASI